jgi:hypothetical protein
VDGPHGLGGAAGGRQGRARRATAIAPLLERAAVAPAGRPARGRRRGRGVLGSEFALAHDGAVHLNGTLAGSVACDRFVINGGGRLITP